MSPCLGLRECTPTATSAVASNSPPEPRSGITAECRRCRSDGCWCAIPPASAAAGLPVHRSQRRAGRHPRMVCPPLVHGDDLPGDPRPSRRRDQRQWPDLAIARTIPGSARVVLPHHPMGRRSQGRSSPRIADWYAEEDPTFSDAIATVRRVLWAFPNFSISRKKPEVEIPGALLQRLIEAVCYTT